MIQIRLADQICDGLIKFATYKSFDIAIPNFFHTKWEMDLFRLTKSDIIVEYEIKISRADFRNDFKKEYVSGVLGNQLITHNKHKEMADKTCKVNRFYFVVPKGLITKEEIPAYAGLLYWYGGARFETIKAAPLIHNKKASEVDPKLYYNLSRTLSARAMGYRHKLQMLKREKTKL